ncbi:hypothetical protein MNBD_PLANCTO02-2200, partial [hydrothermal vent metagenome]
MRRNKLSCLAMAAFVVVAMSFQGEEAKAGIHIGAGPVSLNIGRGYVYAPYSYHVAPPVYYSQPVLVTSHRYPYYAVPQPPIVQTTYYAQPAYRAQPVYYNPPVVVAPYYHSRPSHGTYRYKVKYRRGLFHESVK